MSGTLYFKRAIPATDIDQRQIAGFLVNNTIKRHGQRVQTTTLYEAYLTWCSSRKISPCTLTLFGRKMKGLGYRRIKASKFWWIDLELMDPGKLTREARAEMELQHAWAGAPLPLLLSFLLSKFKSFEASHQAELNDIVPVLESAGDE
jgi:hypothetical protein